MDDANPGYDWFITDATHVLGYALWEYRDDKWERFPEPVTLLVEKKYPTADDQRVHRWDHASRWIDSRARYAVQLTDGTFWPDPAVPDEAAALTTIIPQGEHPTDEND